MLCFQAVYIVGTYFLYGGCVLLVAQDFEELHVRMHCSCKGDGIYDGLWRLHSTVQSSCSVQQFN